MRKRALAAAILVVIAGLAGLVLVFHPLYARAHNLTQREQTLKCLAMALRQYAEADSEQRFPALPAKPGQFLPDWAQVAKGIPDAQLARELDSLTKGLEGKYAYTGYMLVSDVFGLHFLATPESRWRAADADIPVEGQEGLVLRRLQIGVGRHLIQEVYGPSGRDTTECAIPLIWEVPPSPDGWMFVAFMDGHVERIRDASRFPGTPLFVERLRALMNPATPGRPITPVEATALKVAGLFLVERTGVCGLDILHCDREPVTRVGGTAGYGIDLSTCRLFLVPAASPAPAFRPGALRKALYPNAAPKAWVETYIGSDANFHWYGVLAYPVTERIRAGRTLQNGENLFPQACEYYRNVMLTSEPRGTRDRQDALRQPLSVRDYALARFDRAQSEADNATIGAAAILDAPGCHDWPPLPEPAPDIVAQAKAHMSNPSASPKIRAVAGVFLTIRLSYIRGRLSQARVDEESLAMLKNMPRAEVVEILEFLARNLRPFQHPRDASPSENALNECETQKALCRQVLERLGP